MKQVKFCGLTRPQDVSAAVCAGADAIGLVFYPPSPRAVDVYKPNSLWQIFLRLSVLLPLW